MLNKRKINFFWLIFDNFQIEMKKSLYNFDSTNWEKYVNIQKYFLHFAIDVCGNGLNKIYCKSNQGVGLNGQWTETYNSKHPKQGASNKISDM